MIRLGGHARGWASAGLVALVAVGCGGPVTAPGVDATIGAVSTETTTVIGRPCRPVVEAPGAVTTSTAGGSMHDVVGDLEHTHKTLTTSGGHLLEVALDRLEDAFVDGPWAATVTHVAWRSPNSAVGYEVGDRIVARLPRPLECFAAYANATTTAWITIDDSGELLGIGILDTEGAFVSVSSADYTSLLAAGAKVLPQDPFRFRVQVGYCPDPPEPLAFGSEPEALVAFFRHLDDRPRSQGELLQQAAAIERRVGALTDPVTGHVSLPDTNDIVHQLEAGTPEADLVLRPALPLLVRGLDAAESQVVAFTALPSNRVLGYMPTTPVGIVGDDGSTTPVWEVVKFIAPPEPHETVAVHLRSDDGDSVSCLHRENPEPLLVIPYDSIAGDTRAIVDLGSRSYETTTELPPG